MTLTQLKYIIAVDVHRHFGDAAESCFVTQPTLSMQIQKLEEELGMKIFDRSKQPIEPTETGKLLLEQARVIMNEAERFKLLTQEAKGNYRGTLRLGIIPTVAPSLLPRFISKVQKKFPELHLVIEEAQTSTIINKLKLEQLDAGILATPLEDRQLVEEPLYYEPFMAFIPEGHRLHNEQFVVNSELNPKELLLLNEGHCFRNSVLNICGQTDNVEKQNLLLESGNFETLVRLSVQGFGMTLLPYLSAIDLPKEYRQNVKPIADPKPSREISMVYTKNQVKVTLLREVAKLVKSVLPEKLLESPENRVSPLAKGA